MSDILLVAIEPPLSYTKKYAAYSKAHSDFHSMLTSVGVAYTVLLKERSEEDISDDVEYPGYYQISTFEAVISVGQFLSLIDMGVQPKIKSRHTPKSVDATLVSVEAAVRKLESRLAEMSEKMPELSYNSKCDVHVPGLGLMILNETMLLEDSCTDQLQVALDNGWRIVAACPQPDSRRPDYILGRYNPQREEANTGATRHANTK